MLMWFRRGIVSLNALIDLVENFAASSIIYGFSAFAPTWSPPIYFLLQMIWGSCWPTWLKSFTAQLSPAAKAPPSNFEWHLLMN